MAREHHSQPIERVGPDAGGGHGAAARHRSFALTVLAAALVLPAEVVGARLPPEIGPETVNYSRRVWQSADGLPEDFVQAFAQTPDGYLWIGTSGGLVRFDGVRFTVFNRENVSAMADESVYSLFATKDGTLWAGSEGGGLVRLRNGTFRNYGRREGLTNLFVRAIYEDRQQRLWVGTDRGLFRMKGEAFERVDGQGSLPSLSVHAICEDQRGRLLVGGGGLLVVEGSGSAYYASGENLADNAVRALRETDDGTLWIGTISGLRKLEGGIDGDPFRTARIIDGVNISFLRDAKDGVLWVGTYGHGLIRFAQDRIVRFGAPSALPHNNVLAIASDRENDVWVGTQGGLLRLSPSVASTITTADKTPQSINTIYADRNGELLVAALNGRLLSVSKDGLIPYALPAELAELPIRNMFRDSRGALWLGTDGRGVARLSAGGIERNTMKSGLVNDFIRAFAEDREGGIWIGTDGGLSRWHNGAFRNYDTESGLAYGSIRTIHVDRAGDVLVGTDGGMSRVRTGTFAGGGLIERLRGRKIWSICEDREGGLWVGTNGAGLYLLKNGTLSQFTTKDGLPTSKIYAIVEDREGHLWMSGPGGILSIARRDLEQRTADSARPLAVRVYRTSEGLSTNQMNGGVQPAAALTPAGELWFPSTFGAVRLKPDYVDAMAAPPVIIEQLLADDQEAALSNGVRLPPGRGKLEIHYTAVRLRSPERLRFRYWLENFDPDWTQADARRVAYYTNVPPGRYRFHVAAYEAMDPRQVTEHVLDIEWEPPFYRSWWFITLCAMATLSAAWVGYELHARGVRRRFDAVLEERNRLAREMHDTLIQGCIGVSALLEAASSARDVSPPVANQLLDRARNEVRATVDEARAAVWNLRHGSPDTFDLVGAIKEITERIARETGIPVAFEASGAQKPLARDAGPSTVMLVREALHNSVRHAAPKTLSVTMDFGGHGLEVEVRDDGSGFDASAAPLNGHHYGLIGMRERVDKLGGDIRISSAAGAGTSVRFRIPHSVG